MFIFILSIFIKIIKISCLPCCLQRLHYLWHLSGLLPSACEVFPACMFDSSCHMKQPQELPAISCLPPALRLKFLNWDSVNWDLAILLI